MSQFFHQRNGKQALCKKSSDSQTGETDVFSFTEKRQQVFFSFLFLKKKNPWLFRPHEVSHSDNKVISERVAVDKWLTRPTLHVTLCSVWCTDPWRAHHDTVHGFALDRRGQWGNSRPPTPLGFRQSADWLLDEKGWFGLLLKTHYASY